MILVPESGILGSNLQRLEQLSVQQQQAFAGGLGSLPVALRQIPRCVEPMAALGFVDFVQLTGIQGSGVWHVAQVCHSTVCGGASSPPIAGATWQLLQA